MAFEARISHNFIPNALILGINLTVRKIASEGSGEERRTQDPAPHENKCLSNLKHERQTGKEHVTD
jgi:hypothetical protein